MLNILDNIIYLQKNIKYINKFKMSSAYTRTGRKVKIFY